MTRLILLPGMACDGELWQAQLPPLAQQRPVLLADVNQRADSLPAIAALLLAEHAGELLLAGCSTGQAGRLA